MPVEGELYHVYRLPVFSFVNGSSISLQLQEVLDIARSLLEELESNSGPPEFEEKKTKLIQLKFVLEM